MTKTLLLVPTELELKKLRSHLVRNSTLHARCVIELCGFGLIESAIQTSLQLNRQSIQQIVLLGIAGVYSRFPEKVGTASIIHSVVQYGVGSMVNGSFLTPAQMGFAANANDEIQLETESDSPNEAAVANQIQLVSVPCAGESREQDILSKYPRASAEDMEGYAVACVAKAHQIPLTIVRGFSNVVGQDFSKWKIDQAIESAATVLKKIL